MSSANAFKLDWSQNLSFGKELNPLLHDPVLLLLREKPSPIAQSSIVDLRTGGRWFDPRIGQYSFRGFMRVIATGFIPLSLLSVVSTMVMWESGQWFGKNIVRNTPGKHV